MKMKRILLFTCLIALIYIYCGCSGKRGRAVYYPAERTIKKEADSGNISPSKPLSAIDRYMQDENELLKKYKETPNDGKIILELAKYYYAIKKYDLMLTYIEKLKTGDRNLYRKAESGFIIDSFKTLHLNVVNLVREKNYDRALNEYMKLINLFPDRTELYYEITGVYLKTDKSHTALLYISDLYRRIPEDPYINAALGDLYYFTDNKETAKNYYDRATGIEQFYYEPIVRFAQIHAAAGNYEKAENLLLKTFEHHKEKLDLIYQIAKFYAQFNKYDKANIFFKKMIEFYDSDILLLIEASETAILANDNEYAIKLCERILSLDKSNISGWTLLSQAYTNKGDFIAAYRCSEEINKLRKY